MRKYQQLALLIVSTICVILLLFYRHEYLRLRNVLTVLNFFGHVESTNSTCLDFNIDLKKHLTQRYKYAEPRSVWSKLDDHFLYSSFWDDDGEGGTTRTMAVGPKGSFFNYKCRIWFEEGDAIISEKGTFVFNVDFRSKTQILGETTFKYFLKCTPKRKPLMGVPYGVLWTSPSNSSLFSPIFQIKKNEDSAVVCVLPDYTGLPKTDIIEFVSYYNMLGVKDFIIYDSGIQHSIFPFLESTSGYDGILGSVTVLSWNFPISNLNLEKQALIDDCLSRTYNSAKIVAVVAWNEYIMPSTNIDLYSLIPLSKFDDLINVSLETELCCINRDDKESLEALPTFLRKELCSRRDEEFKLFVNLKPYTKVVKKSLYTIPTYTAVVRRYDLCDTLPDKLEDSLPVPEFYSRISSHRLLRLWKSHLNASSIFH